MSAEPTPAEEPTDLIKRQDLEDRLTLFERGFKERLKPELQANATRIADEVVGRAIERFKSDLKTERADQELAELSKKSDRSLEWAHRLLAAAAGFILCLVFGTAFSQCNDLRSRLSTLESKQSK